MMTLNDKVKIHRKSAGFTLIEILVVIVILAFLTSILIIYSRTSEKQLNLFREQAKLISNILRTKSLAIQALRGGEVCGYGVHFDSDQNKYLIFKDLKVAGNCDLSDKVFVGDSAEVVETIDLTGTGIQLSGDTMITDVFFLPPDPKVTLTWSVPVGNEAEIKLTTTDMDIEAIITINNAGQVSMD